MLLGESLVVGGLATEGEIVALIGVDGHATSLWNIMLALISEEVVIVSLYVAVTFKHLLTSAAYVLILEHATQFQAINRLQVGMDIGAGIGLATLLIVHEKFCGWREALIFQAQRRIQERRFIKSHLCAQASRRAIGIIHALVWIEVGYCVILAYLRGVILGTGIVECHTKVHVEPLGCVEFAHILHG